MIRALAPIGSGLHGVRVSPQRMTGSEGVQQITSARALVAVLVG